MAGVEIIGVRQGAAATRDEVWSCANVRMAYIEPNESFVFDSLALTTFTRRNGKTMFI